MSQTIPFKAKVWIAILIILMPLFLVVTFFSYFESPSEDAVSSEYKAAIVEKVGKVVMPSDNAGSADTNSTNAEPVAVATPEETYKATCSACHATGLLGAPKFGDEAAWEERISAAGGIEGVIKIAITGTAKGMPPKGGSQLSDEDFAEVVLYMSGQK